MTRSRQIALSIAFVALPFATWFWLSDDPPPRSPPAAAASPTPDAPRSARAERGPEGAESKHAPVATTPAAPFSAGSIDTAGVSSYPVPDGPAPPPLTATQPAAPQASPYPDGLSAADERALRIRHLLELRELVAGANARLAAGDDDGGKLRPFRDEEAARLADLETWATEHRVTRAEVTRATDQLARLRATAVVDPPRPR